LDHLNIYPSYPYKFVDSDHTISLKSVKKQILYDQKKATWESRHTPDYSHEIYECFGTTLTYEDLACMDIDDEAKTIVPMGTEGSLQYEVCHDGNYNDLYWGHISIYGDLREYCDSDAIKLWITESLNRLMSMSSWMVRQGVMMIHVEGYDAEIFQIGDRNEDMAG